jgi:hypothetical protein
VDVAQALRGFRVHQTARAAFQLSRSLGVKPHLASLHDHPVQHHPVRGATLQLADPYVLGVSGGAGVVAADNVEFGGAYAGLVAGREVRGERIDSVVLLAGRVEGEVHTVMDTRGALIAGMLGGLVAGLILLLGRMTFRRK